MTSGLLVDESSKMSRLMESTKDSVSLGFLNFRPNPVRYCIVKHKV